MMFHRYLRENIMRNITVNYDYHKEAERMRKDKNIGRIDYDCYG